jgi:hypothetical protein
MRCHLSTANTCAPRSVDTGIGAIKGTAVESRRRSIPCTKGPKMRLLKTRTPSISVLPRSDRSDPGWVVVFGSRPKRSVPEAQKTRGGRCGDPRSTVNVRSEHAHRLGPCKAQDSRMRSRCTRRQKLFDDSPWHFAESHTDGVAQRHAVSSVDHNLAIGYFDI